MHLRPAVHRRRTSLGARPGWGNFAGGLTGDKLAIELYADEVRGSITRAELTRMRSLLGTDLLDSPYRLRGPVRCDWPAVHASGEVGEALRVYAAC